MRLQQYAWFLWIAGTALIVASWANVVSAQVGWVGFGISGLGVLISWAPTKVDKSHYPLTQEGFPVEPSGNPIPKDMPLPSGTPLLAQTSGQWWRATVISEEENGEVLVAFPGWDARWTARLSRKFLQVDPDPSRMPINLPPGPLPRWGEKPASQDIRASARQDGVQE